MTRAPLGEKEKGEGNNGIVWRLKQGPNRWGVSQTCRCQYSLKCKGKGDGGKKREIRFAEVEGVKGQ